MGLQRNNGEGTASGTTVTLGNSATGGDAFDLVLGTAGAGATVKFDNTQFMHGSQSFKFVAPNTTDILRLDYTSTGGASGAAMCYVRFSALPSVAGHLIELRSVGGTNAAVFGIGANNKFNVQNAAGVPITWTTTAITANTWYRIELFATPGTGTTDGIIKGAYYLGDSTTAQDTVLNSGATVNAGTATIGQGRFGKITNTTIYSNFWIDDPAFSDVATTFLGPLVGPPTAAFTSSSTGLVASFDGTSSTAVSPATISSYAWTFGDTGTGTGATPGHTYAAPGTYTVGLTVTDSIGSTDPVTNPITVTNPTSNGTISSVTSSTGWTPTSGTALAVLTDNDPATLITTTANPTALELDVVLQPLIPPATGLPLMVILTADTLTAASGHVDAQLLEGATTRSSLTNIALSGGSGSSVTNTVTLTFPWTDVQNVVSWNALKVFMQFTAS